MKYILMPLVIFLYRLITTIIYITAIIILFISIFFWYFKIDIGEELLFSKYHQKVDEFFQPDIDREYLWSDNIKYYWKTPFHYIWGLQPLNNK